jgi:hypothetical protein
MKVTNNLTFRQDYFSVEFLGKAQALLCSRQEYEVLDKALPRWALEVGTMPPESNGPISF